MSGFPQAALIYTYLVQTGTYHRLLRTSAQRYRNNQTRETLFIQVDPHERNAQEILRKLSWKYMDLDSCLTKFGMKDSDLHKGLNNYNPALSFCVLILCGQRLSYRFFTPF